MTSLETVAGDFVDFLIPVVELIGAAVIGFGVLAAFGAYVLSELRVRPQSYEALRLQLGRFLAPWRGLRRRDVRRRPS